MRAGIEKLGDQLFIGEYVGSFSDSTNGQFCVAWFSTDKEGLIEDRHFALLAGISRISRWRSVAELIHSFTEFQFSPEMELGG
ncbi:MAG: hypothetical protein JWM16_1556 [Verrucomicrobiales bacterium]|nr:hypothetical protein [Verrucomicrobiales bacterium]